MAEPIDHDAIRQTIDHALMKPVIFEEHSSVLPEWWRRQEKGKTLICLDAHLDLQYVNPVRMALIENCTTEKQVKDLEKPHHLLPDDAYVYSLENFLYPAFRLGIISRLIWVAPPHVKTAYSQNALNHVQQMDGVSIDELTAFKRHAGGWHKGKLLGLDIVICSYEQLAQIEPPDDALVDIDTDYFVSLPSDESWIDPNQVYQAIENLGLNTGYITLSRSVSSGFMPLRYRFYTDYLAALFLGSQADIKHYERLYHMENRLLSEAQQAIRDACHQELECYPQCAATCYLLSRVSEDVLTSTRYQRQAQQLCPAYKQDLLRRTSEILNRHLPVNQRIVTEFENKLADIDPEPERQSFVHVALGLIYCAAGHVGHACRHYRDYAGRMGQHPELALEIGKLLLQNGQAGKAFIMLQTALTDDKTRTAAHLFLAHCKIARGDLPEAERHLLCAHGLAPAWLDILVTLSDIQRRLEKPQACRETTEKFQQQQSALAALATRLQQPASEQNTG